MKKKIALMGVIALDRPIMLLDESFNNLDVDSNLLISKIIQLMAEKGKLILIISHLIEVLTSLTHCIHLLQDGKITNTYLNRISIPGKEPTNQIKLIVK